MRTIGEIQTQLHISQKKTTALKPIHITTTKLNWTIYDLNMLENVNRCCNDFCSVELKSVPKHKRPFKRNNSTGSIHTCKVVDKTRSVHHSRQFLVLGRRQCQHVTLQDGRILRVLLEQLVHGSGIRTIPACSQSSCQLLLLVLLLLAWPHCI